MAATAGRSLPLLLCRRPAALTAAGCFPALGRRRQQQRHRTASYAQSVAKDGEARGGRKHAVLCTGFVRNKSGTGMELSAWWALRWQLASKECGERIQVDISQRKLPYRSILNKALAKWQLVIQLLVSNELLDESYPDRVSLAVSNKNYCTESSLGLFSLYTVARTDFAIPKMGLSDLQGWRPACFALVWSLPKQKLAKEWFLQKTHRMRTVLVLLIVCFGDSLSYRNSLPERVDVLPALQSEFNHPKLTVELLLKSSPTQWSSSSDEGSKGLTQPCGSVLARAKSYHCAFMEVKLENSAEELVFSLRGEQNSAKQVHQRLSPWQSVRVVYCSTVVPSDEVTVVYQNGLPVISVNLPSRRERCQFTLKPISDSVGVFLQQLQAEDRGIDRVAIYSAGVPKKSDCRVKDEENVPNAELIDSSPAGGVLDGTRVASSTGIDLLLLDDFKLIINDVTYHVRPPKRELLSHENATMLNDVKTLVQQLYTALCIEEHQLNKEKELIGRLEELKEQLAPLEKVRMELSRKAEKRTTLVLWGGLAYMATQFGILARLTWWEYSWDIMEPVTYFITYGSAMAMYAYFVMTRQEYVYPEARDRQYLLFFHKGAKKTRFDLEKYNQLKDAIAQAELDLKRLRDPLQVHLPIQQIEEKD
ncbi:Mcu [Columba livia]|nr:Mcu [Columba livia]